ncbi:MAG: CheR family methyltransferase [Kofleriaceae bacterium]
MDALTPQLFAIFASLVEEASGLHYGPGDRELFEVKLASHATEQGFETLLDFYYRLRYDDPTGAALGQLLEVLFVHESYFFRELPPLMAIVETHLVPVIERRGRARVWSAACAGGEEPLTLAMMLDAKGLLDRVEIVATDLSPAVLERARSGRYTRRALRDGHPGELAGRYLRSDAKGVTVEPRIREAVKFGLANLVADDCPVIGPFDAILCRNVLIYFRDDQVLKVIARLTSRLAPDGLLAVGVSESLLRFGTQLACEERAGAFFYRSAGR